MTLDARTAPQDGAARHGLAGQAGVRKNTANIEFQHALLRSSVRYVFVIPPQLPCCARSAQTRRQHPQASHRNRPSLPARAASTGKGQQPGEVTSSSRNMPSSPSSPPPPWRSPTAPARVGPGPPLPPVADAAAAAAAASVAGPRAGGATAAAGERGSAAPRARAPQPPRPQSPPQRLPRPLPRRPPPPLRPRPCCPRAQVSS